MAQIEEAVQDHGVGGGMELFWQDARFGLRQLRKIVYSPLPP
ncbi:MAG: hypothetical protein ACJ71Q_01305 [Terriglobales bacterium]|jgi:hypothetical protein